MNSRRPRVGGLYFSFTCFPAFFGLPPSGHTLQIVEYGKKLDNFDFGIRSRRQSQAAFQHSGPRADAVRAVPRQRVVFKVGVNEGFEFSVPIHSSP
jgi:hypothetical protein